MPLRRAIHDQARADTSGDQAAAHGSAPVRVLAALPGRRPVSGRARASHPALSRALRLGLPEGHAGRRLRRRGLGLCGERRGDAGRPSPLRAPRRECAHGLEEDPPAQDGVDGLGGPSRGNYPLRRGQTRRLPHASTVFSPLSLARKLSGERLGYDLKENPRAVTDALEAITETILAFAEACFREGAEGIFYSVQAASTDVHPEEEYRRFGEPYDRRILEAVRPKSKLTILHCHGEHLM